MGGPPSVRETGAGYGSSDQAVCNFLDRDVTKEARSSGHDWSHMILERRVVAYSRSVFLWNKRECDRQIETKESPNFRPLNVMGVASPHTRCLPWLAKTSRAYD